MFRLWTTRGVHADRAMLDSESLELRAGTIEHGADRHNGVTIFTQGQPRITLTEDAAYELAELLADHLDGQHTA